MTGSTRGRRRRRGGLLFGGVLPVVLGVVVVGALILTGRVVCPGMSQWLFPIRHGAQIAHAAEVYGVDPFLVAAVVATESDYDPGAVSPAGAVGLMQLLPETASWLTSLPMWQGDSRPDLTDPADNVQLGSCYLAYLSGLFKGQPEAVLAAYNAGQGTVQRWVDTAGGSRGFSLEHILFPETRIFVERVERRKDLYVRIYSDGFPGDTAGQLR